MVYLEVSVDEAIRRIGKLGRDYEQIVERAYWENLNAEYRDFFDQYIWTSSVHNRIANMSWVGSKRNSPRSIKIVSNKRRDAVFF